MPKKPVIRIFAKSKKNPEKKGKPVNTQKVVISDAQNKEYRSREKIKADKAIKTDPKDYFDISDIYEEANLEETPAGELPKTVRSASRQHGRKEKAEDNIPSKPVTDIAAKKAVRKRSGKGKKYFFGVLKTFPFILKKKSTTSNSSALGFAESRKRQSKKGKRNRRVVVYAGGGAFIGAIILVITLTSGGAAAPDSTSQLSGNTATGNSSVSFEPSPSKTLVPTTLPDKTPVPIILDKVVEGYMVKADLYYNEIGYSNNHYKYTDEEYNMLSKVIQGEAGGESLEGKIAVGNVVMNRVLARGYPGDTITQVVPWPGQFHGYNPNTVPSAASRAAARYVLDYEVWVVPQNAYFFNRSSTKTNWGSHLYLFNIGAHAFYSAFYSGRYMGKGIPPALFQRTYKWPTVGCKPEDRVYRLQYMLVKLGYNKVTADKYFGQDTKDALIDFQKKHNIKADGIAGPTTIKALINAFGLEQYYLKFLV